MAEAALLRDALAALDGPFLAVVVGEFNSGKSTVINALLGERFLADGILPTTNEISVLEYLDPNDAAAATSGGGEAVTRERDGLFVRRLPAELLRGMSVVDTPGTNVIVERQQRLTEEFVPRADVVLFVLSADRPLTDSELAFLRYIRQWRKKVVFVVNKIDLLEGEEQVQQLLGELVVLRGGGAESVREKGGKGGGRRRTAEGAEEQESRGSHSLAHTSLRNKQLANNQTTKSHQTAFVSDNARRLLSLDAPSVLPVSSRAALKAKLECGSAVTAGALDSTADDLLQEHPSWAASRFGAFERFVYDFLVGGGGNAASGDGSAGGASVGEGLRLKLQTPLFVADALVAAAGRQLAAEIAAAEAELAALGAVRAQLKRFGDDMRRDAAAQRAAARDVVAAAVQRAERFVDRTLQLSNLGAAAAYVFGGPGGAAGLPVARGFDAEVAQGASDQLAALAAEHAAWLEANCGAQRDYYAAFLGARRRPGNGSGGSGADGQDAMQQQQLGAAAAADEEGGGSGSGSGSAPAPPRASSSDRAPNAAGALAAAPEARAASGDGGGDTKGSSGGGGSSELAVASSSAAVAPPSEALRAVAEFDLAAARVLLEEEVREAFLGTAGSAAGAQGLGLLAAGWLRGALEDALALAVAGLASYVAVLNLPLKRAAIKAKVAKIAGKFADGVAGAMERELEAGVGGASEAVLGAAAPLEAAWRDELARLRASAARRAALAEELDRMERKAANLR